MCHPHHAGAARCARAFTRQQRAAKRHLDRSDHHAADHDRTHDDGTRQLAHRLSSRRCGRFRMAGAVVRAGEKVRPSCTGEIEHGRGGTRLGEPVEHRLQPPNARRVLRHRVHQHDLADLARLVAKNPSRRDRLHGIADALLHFGLVCGDGCRLSRRRCARGVARQAKALSSCRACDRLRRVWCVVHHLRAHADAR